MKRDRMKYLANWKKSTKRKPLIIRGARQVGKTWLMKEFGRTYYRQYVYINFEKSRHLKSLFQEAFDLKKMITALQIESQLKIDPQNTLIIFDEIQELPQALTSLKYFYEDAPEYHIIAAGSLLGVSLHSDVSFPVGKVEFMDLFPMSYLEFLHALGEENLITLLQNSDWDLITTYKTRFIERLRQYYYVGGMPEAVSLFSENSDMKSVRKVQEQILTGYEQDFSKHTSAGIVPRIRMTWNSIPAQLSRENKKFIYGLIKEGARAKDFELALAWLKGCGLTYKIQRVSRPNIPLKAYEDLSAFKLYMVDVGLLGAMTDLDAKSLLYGNALFTEFKGALTEQFILQQLVSLDKFKIYYWSASRGNSEVDFVLQYGNQVIPLEVKAEENLQAKSLKVYHDKFLPQIAIRASMSDYRKKGWLCNIPLYAISLLQKQISAL